MENKTEIAALPQELINLQSTFKTQIDSSDILQQFAPFFYELAKIKKDYSEIKSFDNPDSEDSLKANEIRKRIVKVRTSSERLKDETGKDYHTVHKMITSANTLINTACKMDESTLEKVVKHVEIQEENRLKQLLIERTEILVPYGFNPDDIIGLEKMTEDVFAMFLAGAKKSHEDRVAAEKQKHEDELLAKQEAEKNRLENERLKKEQQEKDLIRKKRNDELRPYIVFIRDYNAVLDMDEQTYAKELADIKIAAEQQWQDDARRREIENEKMLEAEQLAAKLKAKEDAEAAEIKRKALEEKRITDEKLAAAKAPDKEKLMSLILSLTKSIDEKMNDMELTSDEAKKINLEIIAKYSGFIKWALTQIETL